MRDFVREEITNRNTCHRWVWTQAIVGSQAWFILRINPFLLIENDHKMSDL